MTLSALFAPEWENARVANTKLGRTAVNVPAKAEMPACPPKETKNRKVTNVATIAWINTSLYAERRPYRAKTLLNSPSPNHHFSLKIQVDFRRYKSTHLTKSLRKYTRSRHQCNDEIK